MPLAWSDEDTLMTLVIVSGIGAPLLYFFIKSKLSGTVARRDAPGRDALFAALDLPQGDPSRLIDGNAVAGCDWRAEPKEVVAELNAFLPASHQLFVTSRDDGGAILSKSNETVRLSEEVLDAKSEAGGVTAVVAAANQLLEGDYEFRQLLDDPTDTLVFVGRPTSVWQACEARHGREVQRRFARVGTAPRHRR